MLSFAAQQRYIVDSFGSFRTKLDVELEEIADVIDDDLVDEHIAAVKTDLTEAEREQLGYGVPLRGLTDLPRVEAEHIIDTFLVEYDGDIREDILQARDGNYIILRDSLADMIVEVDHPPEDKASATAEAPNQTTGLRSPIQQIVSLINDAKRKKRKPTVEGDSLPFNNTAEDVDTPSVSPVRCRCTRMVDGDPPEVDEELLEEFKDIWESKSEDVLAGGDVHMGKVVGIMQLRRRAIRDSYEEFENTIGAEGFASHLDAEWEADALSEWEENVVQALNQTLIEMESQHGVEARVLLALLDEFLIEFFQEHIGPEPTECS